MSLLNELENGEKGGKCARFVDNTCCTIYDWPLNNQICAVSNGLDVLLDVLLYYSGVYSFHS